MFTLAGQLLPPEESVQEAGSPLFQVCGSALDGARVQNRGLSKTEEPRKELHTGQVGGAKVQNTSLNKGGSLKMEENIACPTKTRIFKWEASFHTESKTVSWRLVLRISWLAYRLLRLTSSTHG